MEFVLGRVENIVGTLWLPAFSPLPTIFPKASYTGSFKVVIVWYGVKSQHIILYVNLLSAKVLNHDTFRSGLCSNKIILFIKLGSTSGTSSKTL